MAITLNDVVAAVNAELENLTHRGACSATGDGASTLFHIAPLGYYIVSGTLVCSIDDTPTSAYTMDYTNGICTMNSAPADASDIYWTFSYQAWPTAVVEDAVTYASYAMFPYFYNSVTEDVTLDGEDNEYDLDPCEEVVRVMTAISGTNNYTSVSRKKYEILDMDAVKTLRFFTTPAEGTARVTEIERPELTDLPDRAMPALTSYACYYLIINKMAPRVRSDVAIATQGSGTLSPRQMADAANAFYMRYQMQVAQTRMRPWSIY